MEKILAPIKIRILQYIDFKGFEKKSFFENLNVSASNFRSNSLKSEVGGDVIAKILSFYNDINPEWLIIGKGNMLKDEKSTIYKVDDEISNMAEKPASAYKEDNANEILGLLKDKITVLENSIAIMQENKAMQQDKITTQAKEITHLKQEITRLKSNSQNTEKIPSVPDNPMPNLPAGTSSKSRSHLRK